MNMFCLGKQQLITNIFDYKFYYPNSDRINVKINELKTNSILSNLELQKCVLLNKAYYLLECIKELKLKKVIVFLKSISESVDFSKILTLLNTFFTNKLVVNSIDCNTRKGDRTKILSRFKNKNDSVNILCNVHILDEGIDIPECDSVYLTHPNYNPINFIQRISRCNRIKPSSSGVANIANVLIWAKDESKILNVDKLISEYLKLNVDNTINNEYIRNKSQLNKHVSTSNNNINLSSNNQQNIHHNNQVTTIAERTNLLNNDIPIQKQVITDNGKLLKKCILYDVIFKKPDNSVIGMYKLKSDNIILMLPLLFKMHYNYELNCTKYVINALHKKNNKVSKFIRDKVTITKYISNNINSASEIPISSTNQEINTQ